MRTIELNGLWHFAIDQDPEYHRKTDYSRPTSLRHWELVPVPGCWNCYAERYDLYEGVAWFVRQFELNDLPADSTAQLQFGGVNYLADVFLNGQHLGTHEGGYTAFCLDATAAIQKGANRLAVRVDNRRLKVRLPAVLGWYNYGGIHRDVKLTIRSRAHILAFRISAEPAGEGAQGAVSVSFGLTEKPCVVLVRLFDPTGKRVWEGQSSASKSAEVPFKLDTAARWEPSSPRLYRCDVELRDGDRPLDRASCSFGVRRIEVRRQQVLLNGQPLRLKGLCYLYDHPAVGMTFDPRVASRDLDDLQALGVNCLRSHFPLPEQFLDECDRRGLMLWLEVPIYCVAPAASERGSFFAQESFRALALQMLREMVEQAANHPSVVFWGIGNECSAEHPEAGEFFRACVEQVRALDATRPIGYAALYGAVGCAAELVDVLGLNQYWGWYDRIFGQKEGKSKAKSAGKGKGKSAAAAPSSDLPELEKCLAEKSRLGKPILLTEFGADAVAGFRSASGGLWSEDYQARLIAQQLQVAAKHPAVCGTFPFLYADYRDPSKPLGHHWHGANLKGIVDYSRNPKLAWQTLKDAYET